MPSESIQQKKEYSLRNFTVLIVEDYEFMTDLLSGMLREFGVGRILIAPDGEQAKHIISMSSADRYNTARIDMALIDWLMPHTNGVELLHWIRRQHDETIKFMPTILLSAYTSEEVVCAARDNGANEAMIKPVSAEMLARRILHIIDYPRPYIKAPNFFGPDRRRQEKEFTGNEKRLKNEKDIQVHKERL